MNSCKRCEKELTAREDQVICGDCDRFLISGMKTKAILKLVAVASGWVLLGFVVLFMVLGLSIQPSGDVTVHDTRRGTQQTLSRPLFVGLGIFGGVAAIGILLGARSLGGSIAKCEQDYHELTGKYAIYDIK